MKSKDTQRLYRLHAPIYDATRRFVLFGRRRAVDLLDPKADDVVADFACGTGLNFPHLKRKGARQIIGIDASEAMLKRAKKRSPDVILLKADLSSFSPPTPINKALCTYALSIIGNWEEVVMQMKSALAPDGTVVFLDFYPNRSLLRPFNPLFSWWLGLFGVDPRKPIIPFLRRHFQEVEIFVPRFGYLFWAKARMPIDEARR